MFLQSRVTDTHDNITNVASATALAVAQAIVTNPQVGLATSPGTCAGTCGFIRGKTHANGSPMYESPGAYKTHESGCQFWITRNLYGLPVQPVYTLVSIHALQQQRGAWAVSKMKWDENQTRDGKFRPDNVNH